MPQLTSIFLSQLLQSLQEIYDQQGNVKVYLVADARTDLPITQVTVSPLGNDPEERVVRLRGPTTRNVDPELEDW